MNMFEVQGCQDHHNAGARKVYVHKAWSSFGLTLLYLSFFCPATLVQAGASFKLLPGNKNKKVWEDGVVVEFVQKSNRWVLPLGVAA